MAYYATYMPNELGELQTVVINAGVGFVLPYYGETAPPGTLACDGSEISREAYKELFQVLGTKAGAGDAIRNFTSSFDLRGWTSNNTADASIGTQIVPTAADGYMRERGLREACLPQATLILMMCQTQELFLTPLAPSLPPPRTAPSTLPCSGASSTSSFI